MPYLLLAEDSSFRERLVALLNLWPIWLPLILGGWAIYHLLPRPRPYPVSRGASAGLGALVVAAWVLAPVHAVSVEAFLFYAFAALAILGGALLVTQANPARAALSFVLVVLSTCGLFLLLAAPFLMAATIIIYAGAIIVTFLFVLMLAQQAGLSDADARSREPMLATVTGFVLLFAILYVVRGYRQGPEPERINDLLRRVESAMKSETSKEIVKQVYPPPEDEKDEKSLFQEVHEELEKHDKLDVQENPEIVAKHGFSVLKKRVEDIEQEAFRPAEAEVDEKLKVTGLRAALDQLSVVLVTARERLLLVRVAHVPEQRVFGKPEEIDKRGPVVLSRLSGAPPNAPLGEIRRSPDSLLPEVPAENSAYLGRSLFTDYLLPVELGGLLLLVATVGAIAIAQRRAAGTVPGERLGRRI